MQELPEGHGPGVGQSTEPRPVAQVIGQQVGPGQASLVFQRQERGGDKGLADTRSQHGCLGRHHTAVFDIGEAGGRGDDSAVRQGKCGRRAGKAVACAEVLQCCIQPRRKIGMVPGARGLAGTEACHDAGRNEESAHVSSGLRG